MGTAVMPPFDPQVTERIRPLPRWVAPQIQMFDPLPDAREEGAKPPSPAASLNWSAAAIRDLCDGRRSVFQIVEELRRRYIAEDVELYVDVTRAVVDLRRLGLIGPTVVAPSDRPPTKFVMGIEDKPYFHWQLPILFESLAAQLPDGWECLVVVCNNHDAISDPLLLVFETYGITHLTGANHPVNENMDFAAGGDQYAPLNRIEALRVVAPHVRDDDLVFLLDTDNFLYRELDLAVFPRDNALYGNEIIDHRPFFTHTRGGPGVDLQKVLKSIGCQNRLGGGGVAVFLTGRTVKNKKFIQDCFRFTQVVYLLGKIAGLQARTTWISEMPSFALSLTANGIPYQVIDSQSFMVEKARTVPPGTFYHYYGDLKDTSVEGAFYDSDWHKQRYFEADFLNTNLEAQFRAAVTPHEQYFFELAMRARHRLSAPSEHRGRPAGARN
jgi:hypothetical protein